MNAGFEKELALIEERDIVHYHFDERHAVFESLRHQNGRVCGRAVLSGDNTLAFAACIFGSNANCEVYCSRWDGIVYINSGFFGYLALEVLAFYEVDGNFAHDMAELEVDRIVRGLNTFGGSKQKIGCLIVAHCCCLSAALIGADFEGKVGDRADSVGAGVICIDVVASGVPV